LNQRSFQSSIVHVDVRVLIFFMLQWLFQNVTINYICCVQRVSYSNDFWVHAIQRNSPMVLMFFLEMLSVLGNLLHM
jgi:hypothetical protein